MGPNIGNLGTGYGNVGVGKQSAGISGAGAQVQGGMVPQAEQQAIDTSLQNTWNEGQAYPFQTTGWLNNMIQGLREPDRRGGVDDDAWAQPDQPGHRRGDRSGGYWRGHRESCPHVPAVLRHSYERECRSVGKTFDGQTIHRFNYKGDPRTQIGLVAQEVEQRHPEAVHQGLGGLKQLDYEAATRDRSAAASTAAAPSRQVSIYDLGVGKSLRPARWR